MNNKESAIQVSCLKKSYQTHEVLKNVTFSVPGGSIYALLGSNGAGKTTTVRILTTQLPADGGSIKIKGWEAGRETKEIRKIISLTGQFSALDETLTGRENLVIMGRMRHIREPEQKAAELLEYFSLSSAKNQRAAFYSGGMKRKLDIAMSLVGNPEVLFLDEPTTGLDPQSRRSMWEMIKKLKDAGTTVFLTTQYLEEAEELADRIGILDKGRIIAEGTSKELKSLLPHGCVEFCFEEEGYMKGKMLLTKFKTEDLKERYAVRVYTDGKADTIGKMFHDFQERKIKVREFQIFTPNLEDVFLALVEEGENVWKQG
ncbi:MAG: ATP-binding cassette domain-containing protein [Eubacteriales bacterium]|nr:ATP-binding cassette domain-containing protein [Eubacteriales bacterium]